MEKVLGVELVDGSDLLAEAKVSGSVFKTYQGKIGEKPFVIVRLQNEILGFEVLRDGKFIYRWKINFEARSVINQVEWYPLWTFDVEQEGADNIIFRDFDGLKFYNWKEEQKQLELLGSSGLFHDVYGKNQTSSMGRFFSQPKNLGLMRGEKKKKVFYLINSDCLGKYQCDLLRRLKDDPGLSEAWNNPDTRFYLTKLQRDSAQEIFALRTSFGLEFHRFNKNYTLEKIFNNSFLENSFGTRSEEERLFFGGFTNQFYQDILHLNSSGLFLYQFDTSSSDYTMLNYAPQFSRASGWTNENSDSIFIGDFNDDTISDIMFTGVDGLAIKTFNNVLESWTNLMSSGSDDFKFAKLVGTTNVNNTHILLLQSSDSSLKSAKIVTKLIGGPSSRDLSLSLPKKIQTKKPGLPDELISVYNIENIPKTSISTNNDFRWSEQYARNFEEKFLQNVPNPAGSIAFNIPLVDVTLSQYLKIQLALSFSDQSRDANMLGVGWNIPLLNNHIRVDYQCSVFEDDYVFSFYGLGRRIKLKRDLTLEIEGSNIMRFTVPEHDEMRVFYHKGSNSYWIIETPTERFIYGMDRKNGATQINLSWEKYRCGKSDTNSLQQIPIAWFIKERHDKATEKSIFYRYNIVTKPVVPEGSTYTQSLSLENINDGRKTLVAFTYAKKTSPEASPFNIIENGKVMFPIPLYDDFYMTQISIRSEDLSQTFKFAYQLIGEQRFLTEFIQIFPQNVMEKVITMEYAKVGDEVQMMSCVLPRGSKIAFDYKRLHRVIAEGAMVKKFPVGDKPEMTPGTDYQVISFIRNDNINLRIHNGIDNDFLTTFHVGNEPFKSQVIIATASLFLIFVASKNHKELVVFEKKDSVWVSEPMRYNVDSNSTVHLGGKFVAFVAESVQVFYWDADDEASGLQVKHLMSPNPGKKILRTLSYNRMLISYDDSHLIVFYLDAKNEWKVKNVNAASLNIKNYDAITTATINMFDIKDDIKTQLIASVKANLLQLDRNQIVLTKLQENRGTISVVVNMMLLDSNMNVVEHVETINRENLFNLNQDETQSKTKYRLKYSKIDGKFRIRIHDILSGEVFEQLEQMEPNRRVKEKREYISMINAIDDSQNYFKQIFLLDWNKYHARLTSSGLLCGDDIKYEMTGSKWEKKPILSAETSAATFRIGKKFVIEQKDPKLNELDFYEVTDKHRQLIHQMKLGGEFVNAFPAYLAYQTASTDINVLTFTPKNTFAPVRKIKDEKLIYGDMNGMMTLVNSTSFAHAEPQEIRYRPLSDVLSGSIEYAISQRTLTSGNLKRVTNYERSFNIDKDGNLEETFEMIPGGAKDKFGCYQEIKSMNNTDKTITKQRKIFHDTGELKTHEIFEDIETRHLVDNEKQEQEKEDENEKHAQKLMDQSNTLEISDLNPYFVIDRNVAHFGFEFYENNFIFDQKDNYLWSFPVKNVIRKGFSLTGESFLRLSDQSDAFEGTMKPKNQKELYVASCWIRTNGEIEMNTRTSIFEADLKTSASEEFENIPANVKRRIGEWNYLEILIDFKNFRDKFQKQNETIPKFEVILRINGDIDATIDIDNVRFAPINHDFRADVFNSAGRVTATIFPNGVIKRKLYNKYQQEIASVDGDGNLLEIKSLSETGRLIFPRKIQNRSNHLTFKATENSIFDPVEWWKFWKISGLNTKGNWNFAPGQIWHKKQQTHQIVIPFSQINMKSNVLRFDYALNSQSSSMLFKVREEEILELSKSGETVELVFDSKKIEIASSGELIIAIEISRKIIWIDGVLVRDTGSELTNFNESDPLTIEISGNVGLESFLTLNNPNIIVEYFNSWGEQTQIINVESENIAQVTEVLHDNLGRRSITTKATRMNRKHNQQLTGFYESFITNDDYESPQSVWFTHRLEGDVNQLNLKCDGFPYKRTEFEKNPSRDKQAIGLPGKDFSITGPYSIKIESKTEISFLLNLFPVQKGFSMYTKVNENGSRRVTVTDVNEKKVAIYTRVPGYDHSLSINEYDSNGRIIKILPPIYHEKANSFERTDPWNFDDESLTLDEKKLQKLYGTHFSYDDYGNLIKKSTPDSGTVEYVYDQSDNQRFMKLSNGEVIYFIYDDAEQLKETGKLKELVNIDELKSLAKINELPDRFQRVVSQEFSYSNQANDPAERKATKKFVTHNENDKVVDEISFDLNDHVVRRSMKLSTEPSMNVERTYEMGKVSCLSYPKESIDGQELNVIFKYNKKGLVTSIGTLADPIQFAEFSYTVDGQLESEKIQPSSNFGYTRTFGYQTAGFLEKISDPFLKEGISYTRDGYGQKGFGDGIITLTAFNATWVNSIDPKHFRVNMNELTGDIQNCLNLLRDASYLSATEIVEKSLNFRTEPKLPIQCKSGKIGYQLSELMARKQVPKFYGHRFAYGNHQELTKAKYFTDVASMKAVPLQPNSFSKEIQNMEVEDSLAIWKILKHGDFIVTDQRYQDPIFATGTKGKEPLLRENEIEDALSSMNSPSFQMHKVIPEIINFVIKSISTKQFTTQDSFEAAFLAMHGFPTKSDDWQIVQLKQKAKQIFDKMSAKNLLPIRPKLLTPLNPKLREPLKYYLKHTPDILKVLNQHWLNDIGESPFDLCSYNIDANGNHRLFYNGYKRYKINYQDGTNKIQNITIDDITSAQPQRTFDIEHDENGNIIKALHKGIESIEYYVTTQRTKSILMTDGRKLQFYYDAVGERILKQVFDSKGNLTLSMKYVRDEKGKVLVDKKVIYHAKPQPPQTIITKYIYGPRGLVGFIRNGDFFSVMTDHGGSIKLIIKNRQVVASYDYLPYGDLMRKFVSKPEYEISYRFTGQEYDEETGLYNYHARLYDSSIGRFYQLDPQAQYYSGYVYGGNSPISGIDPDGEFFFLFAVAILAIGGAYIGGAKANDSWNPIKWNWESPDTYIGMGFGALAGASLPYTAVGLGLTGSLVAAGVGLGTGYLGASAANKNLDPTKWDWSSPKTYAGFFDGFTLAFNVAGGLTDAGKIAQTFSNTFMKQAFVPAVVTGAIGFGFVKAASANNDNYAFWEWNWDSEGMAVTFGEMMDGFSTVVSVSATIGGIRTVNVKGSAAKDFGGSFKEKLGKTLNDINNKISQANMMKLLAKVPKSFREKVTGVFKALQKASNAKNLDDMFDLNNYKLNERSTYEGLINGYMEGKALASESFEINKSMVKFSKQQKVSESLRELNRSKRSVKWKITLALDPEFIKYFVRPEIHAVVAPHDDYKSHTDRGNKSRVPEVKSEIQHSNTFGYIVPFALASPSTTGIPYENSFSNSSFNILEIGDKWLQQTDTVGNLTLLNLLVDTFINSKKKSKKCSKAYSKTNVENQLITSEIVNDFIEKFMQNAETCLFTDFIINALVESIDLKLLNREVEKAIRVKNYPKVVRLMEQKVLTDNLKFLIKHSSKDKVESLRSNTEAELKRLLEKLDKYDDTSSKNF